MTKKILLILSAMLAAAGTTAYAASSFSDVPDSHWAHDAIVELADKGIIDGMDNGEYQPDGILTRAQFMKLLTCALEKYDSDEKYTSVFSDTAPEAWYTSYISSGVYGGITDGESAYFYPDEAITRGEAVEWMINGMGIVSDNKSSFSDVSSEMNNIIGTAQEYGLINGYDDGTFRPKNTLTRAEAAAIIKRVSARRTSLPEVREDAANEIVLKEGVKTTTSDVNTNTVTNVNERNHTVTISNPDSVVSGLIRGDILYMPICDKPDNGLLAKVSGIKKNGSNIVITCAQPTLNEVVESIDISTVVTASAEDFEGADITGSAAAGKNVLRAPHKLGASRLFADNSADFSAKSNGGVQADFRNGKAVYYVFESANVDGSVHYETSNFSSKKGAYASLDFTVSAFVDVNLSGENFDTNFRASANIISTADAFAGYSKSASADQKIKLPNCDIAVAGPLMVKIEPYLVISAEGDFTVTAEAKLENMVGCSFENGHMKKWNATYLEPRVDADAEGSLEVGPEVNAYFQIGDLSALGLKDVRLIETSADFGIGVNGKTEVKQSGRITNNDAKYSGNQNTPDENGVIHNCYLCFEGDIYRYGQFSAGLSNDINKVLKDVTGKEISYKSDKSETVISPWHYSTGAWGGPEFALEKCPHKLVKVSGNITDISTAAAIPGARITAADETAVADSSGYYEFYAESGLRELSVSAENYRDVKQKVEIPSDKGIVKDIKMNLNKVKLWGYVKNSRTGDIIPNAEVTIGDIKTSSGSGGYYEVYIEPGQYGASAFAGGYYDYWRPVTVNDEDTWFDLLMDPDKVRLWGYVKDSSNGYTLSGVKITIGGSATTSAANGFYELYVKPGNVGIAASADGYYDYWKTVTVNPAETWFDILADPNPKNAAMKAYASYLRGMKYKSDYKFNLIYIDNDDIPELVFTYANAGRIVQVEILTYKNNKLIDLGGVGSYGTMGYKPKQNLINGNTHSVGVSYGADYNYIYTISNGKLAILTSGTYTYDTERYNLNGQTVSGSYYNKVFSGFTMLDVSGSGGVKVTDSNIKSKTGY